MFIPMSSPDLTQAEMTAVQDVLETRYLSIGPRVVAFEQAIADYTQSAHGIAVNSGTSGLHMAMIAANVQENDLVITTPFSFVASANAILYERGVPVFVDVDERTGNIDPAGVVNAVEDIMAGNIKKWLPPTLQASWQGSPANLKAILPVHAFGQPADMEPIMQVAKKYNLAVVEDSCESLGADYKGVPSGTIGDVGVFAFYPNKQMTTGEGGMIVTNNEEWANLFRSLRNQGRDVFDAWLNHTRLGYNYRLDEMSAALGLVQAGRLEELLAKRAQVAAWYNERLADLTALNRPHIADTTTKMSWFVYVVQVNAPFSRNELMAQLAEANIPSRPYFTPIHLQPFYQEQFGFRPGDFPTTEKLGHISLALPFSSIMTEAQVDYVSQHLHTLLH